MAVKDREIHTWIFGIGGSETDNVITQLVRGTKRQAIRHMLHRVRNDRNNDSEKWVCGTTSMDAVQTTCNGFYAYNEYSSYHIDYSLTIAEEPLDLSGT